MEPEEDMPISVSDEEDAAEKQEELEEARKQVGFPEYDPDQCLVSSVPKFQTLLCNHLTVFLLW